MNKIQLGDKVKDTVTGFKGIAMARTTWLQGCDRITIQPKGVDKDGKTYRNETFDEPQVEVITPRKKPIPRKSKTGGPMPSTPKYS